MDDAAHRSLMIRRGDQPGDLGWVVQTHGVVYAEQFGWGVEFEALVAGIVGGAGDLLIAEIGGVRAGCVMLTPGDEASTGKLRVLLVAPRARGRGVAGALVDDLLRLARSRELRRLTLWTTDTLSTARRVYERAGFTLDHEAPSRLFEQDLVEQTWSLTL